MSLVFRPARAEDVDAILPLMYSAGPEAFKYVFSVNSELEVLDFLHLAFLRGDGEFGYKDHIVALEGEQIVALVGMRQAEDNLSYTLSAARSIFAFYGIINGLRVAIRGLRFERIVSPPGKGVLCLHNLGVSEEMRGKGCGQQLIAYFLDEARQHGVKAVGLDVAETNPRAKALYLRLGFETKGTTSGGLSNKYGRGVSHDYMEFSLGHQSGSAD